MLLVVRMSAKSLNGMTMLQRIRVRPTTISLAGSQSSNEAVASMQGRAKNRRIVAFGDGEKPAV